MESWTKDSTAAERLQNGERIKGMKLKKLDMENERNPLMVEFNEIHYKHLTAIENVSDVRSRDLFSDDDRKELELEHRVRIDPKVIELRKKLNQFQYEIDKIQIEIDFLEDRREVLVDIFSYFPPEKPPVTVTGENK